ncbi:lactonase family protein [Streptomyces sp. 8N706]|uniref:lactonase family protein n=1 Tax=Streptomyces sp. 8N706 TaxID=3457416 RepID=UPI003FD6ABC9
MGRTENGASMGRRRFLTAVTGGLTAGGLTACGDGEGRAEEPYPRRGTRRTPDTPRASPRGGSSASGPRPLYLGAYTSGSGGGGLGLATYDPETGRIASSGELTGLANPSFLALSPSGKALYAVNEQERGGVTAMAIDDNGRPRVLGTRDTGGSGPCHLSVHPSGRYVLSAHYGSGSVAVHPIEKNGALGERTDLVRHSRPGPGPGQDGPHAHQVLTSPDGGHVLAVDLGNDTIYTYRLDPAAGTLEQTAYATLPPGTGPRHLTFHPSGGFAYLANELDNTVVVCRYDRRTGRLSPGTPQPTGTGEVRNYPAQLLVTPDGAHAYLANRGHDSITRYAVEDAGARLRLLDTVPVRGESPRHIAFSPSGRRLFAANQTSGSVTVFSVNGGSGRLKPLGRPFAAPAAACVLPGG